MFLFSNSPKCAKERYGIMDFAQLAKLVRKGLAVHIDSRNVKEGDCFVAMPGTKVRGIDYIPMAIKNGAQHIVAAEADRTEVTLMTEKAADVCYVPNTAKAYGELAAEFFGTGNTQMKTVAITGTNGKTTTSYIIEHLMMSAGLIPGVLGTVSYRWPGFSVDAKLTTPDCWMTHELLANMNAADVDAVVMEVSSHALEQYRVGGIDFDVAVFTNLTQDHLDYHGDMESYFKAKAKLFIEYPAEGKCCAVNHDDQYGRRLLGMCENAIGYGLDEPVPGVSSLCGRIKESTVKGLVLECSWKGKTWEISSPLVGEHNALNLLAAQAVGLCLGLNCRDFRKLSEFKGVPGRLERVENELDLDIFIDYAHTPDALLNVQRTLKALDFSRLITVFGCGGDRDKTKRPLMAEAVARYADVAVLTSDNPRSEEPEAIMDDAIPGLKGCEHIIREADRSEAIRLAIAEMWPGDVLLIAGKGHESYQEIKGVRHDYHDSKAVRAAIAEAKQ